MMTSSHFKRLKARWLDIPMSKDHAVTYKALEQKWGMSSRAVRKVLYELSRVDFGDPYILIRSSHNKGFYKTINPVEIRKFRKEITSRARECLAPLTKIDKYWGGRID